jgi:hypothetical protein
MGLVLFAMLVRLGLTPAEASRRVAEMQRKAGRS